MRDISSTQKAAQESTSATPYIFVRIDSANYSSNTGKLLGIEHHELQYSSDAVIILRNDDRSLDDVDLVGQDVGVGYGHVTSVGNEYEDMTSRMYVKSQHFHSFEGKCICVLQCEGVWDVLREKRAILLADPPSYDVVYDRTKTIYELIKMLLASCDYDLDPLGDQDDGIINDFKPYFELNYFPYENIASIIYRLIQMTKCFIRAKSVGDFKIIYPHEDDDVDEKYYSRKAHFFHEYTEKKNLLIPNKVAVYGNRDETGIPWENPVVGTAEDADQIAKYDAGEILWTFPAPTILTEEDATNRAAAILARFKGETLAGRLVVPHDARVELYDRVRIYDSRGT